MPNQPTNQPTSSLSLSLLLTNFCLSVIFVKLPNFNLQSFSIRFQIQQLFKSYSLDFKKGGEVI